MNFFIFICKIIYASEFEYTLNSEDSLSIHDNYLEISYEFKADDQVKKCFDKLEFEIEDERKEKLVKITSFYYKKIQEYTNNESDTFLAYFTTWICYFVYNPDSEIDIQKYNPEFLFNLIRFKKFFEFCKEDKNMKSNIKDILVKLTTYRLQGKNCNYNEWWKQNYDSLKEKYPEICTNIENSSNRDNKIDIAVLENLVLCLNSHEYSSCIFSRSLINATHEYQFGFFLCLKCMFLLGKKNEYFTLKSLTEKEIINPIEISAFTLDATSYIDESFKNIDFESYKKITKYISEPIFRKILKVNEDGFEKIYEFSGKNDLSNIEAGDSNSSLEFIEYIVERKEINYINALYVFLKNISKTEYHEYISAVLCLKAFCFKEILTCKQTMIRSIVEILFLADVLKMEFENENKNASAINTYRVHFIAVIKNYLDEQRIEYDKNLVLNTFNHFLLPRTSSILKTFIYVELFTNSIWRDDYNIRLEKYCNENQQEFDEKLLVNEENIFFDVFRQEFSRLSPEERKKIFTIPVTKAQTSDNKNESKEFGIIDFLLFVLIPIVFIGGVILGVYWYIYKKGK
ncbi:hypothetical protein CWI38_0721p0020 [Hamiltosporidium tvaerminnensis]|uniref:Uncharacterized protein n=1 Tax=Hamiltosporidium tvaerminnensis TaxID=1176355 RepID=A0A4Q9LXE3_9MICR|nr:hypothetical protein LUQ84_3438 [Hamiltosporidium tvaerminnensis]TBU12531.1 hypothetical protein CWI38_0721p0020 [Hamiltosporidium tvaerminnensis]